MRIYCGLATAGHASFAAIVDDAGRAIAVAALDEDGPRAYTALCQLLAAHGGDRYTPIATDDGSGTTPQLCTAAGHPVTVTDEEIIGRFTRDDPAARQPGAQRALAAARALQTGAVTAIAGGAVRNLARLRPLLCSAAALAAGRATAVSTLRGVLRELYPAALRAFDDPGAPRPLAVLDALPEPAAAAYCREDEVAHELATAGLPDTTGVIVALRTAAAEYAPSRRSGDDATRATVRTAVQAVRVYDDGLKGLAEALTERLKQSGARGQTRTRGETPGVDLPAMPEERGKRRTIPAQRITVPPAAVPEPPQQAAPQPPVAPPVPPSRPAPSVEESRSSKITSLPTRRSARAKSDSGGFPQMPEPPVFNEGATSAQPVLPPHAEPETVPAGLKLPPPNNIAPPPVRPAPPVPEIDGDNDEGLTIFAQAKSAWFTGVNEDEEPTALDWSMPTDEAWRSAQKTVTPSTGEATAKGLPRRVPQANLVPGSALPEDPGPIAIERDPQLIAANTAGYFRGWNRARRDAVDAAPVGANGSTVRLL
ncbi:hypothetical protein AB0I28_34555 [Phytomonospora sp. NPDC050363]|uniref:hypothetical protein n=1 Tax=Phytomonospora sp. NPDC050363 TaxID=3155642 RepID=UPI0033DDE5D8